MFEFEPGLMIWATVSFGILVLLLYKVALPPLLSFLVQREKMIADQIAEASVNQKKSQELLEEYKKKLADIHQTAEQVVERAKSEGEKIKGELLGRAKKQADLIAERTKQDLAQEKEKIVAEVRKETADFVVSVAGKVLRRVITLEDHRHLIEESLKEVET